MENLDYLKLQKKIVNSENLDELKDAVKEVNQFVKDKKIKSGSDEFKKLQERINIVLIKLRKKLKTEQKTIVVTEQQLSRIVKLLSEVDSTVETSNQNIDFVFPQ